MSNKTTVFVEYWFVSSSGKILPEYEEMTEINQLSTVDNFEEIRYQRKSAEIVILNNVAVAINER